MSDSDEGSPRRARRRPRPALLASSASSDESEVVARRPRCKRTRVLSESGASSSGSGPRAGRRRTLPALRDSDCARSASSEGEAEHCAICLARLGAQRVASPESCEHVFCLDCITEWAANVNTCPVDRGTFRSLIVRACAGGRVLGAQPVRTPERAPSVEIMDIEDPNPMHCEVCGGADSEDTLLLCEACDRAFHMQCLSPPLANLQLEMLSRWMCSGCREELGSLTDVSDLDWYPDVSEEEDMYMYRSNQQLSPVWRRLVASRRRSRRRAPRASPPPGPSTSRPRARRARTLVIQYEVREERTQPATRRVKKKLRKKKSKRERGAASGPGAARRALVRESVRVKLAAQRRECGAGRAGAGGAVPALAPALSLFGSAHDLLYFSDDSPDEHAAAPAAGGVALASRAPPSSAVIAAYRQARRKAVRVPSPARAAPATDVLSSILASQALLHSRRAELSVAEGGRLRITPRPEHAAEHARRAPSQPGRARGGGGWGGGYRYPAGREPAPPAARHSYDNGYSGARPEPAPARHEDDFPVYDGGRVPPYEPPARPPRRSPPAWRPYRAPDDAIDMRVPPARPDREDAALVIDTDKYDPTEPTDDDEAPPPPLSAQPLAAQSPPRPPHTAQVPAPPPLAPPASLAAVESLLAGEVLDGAVRQALREHRRLLEPPERPDSDEGSDGDCPNFSIYSAASVHIASATLQPTVAPAATAPVAPLAASPAPPPAPSPAPLPAATPDPVKRKSDDYNERVSKRCPITTSPRNPIKIKLNAPSLIRRHVSLYDDEEEEGEAPDAAPETALAPGSNPADIADVPNERDEGAKRPTERDDRDEEPPTDKRDDDDRHRAGEQKRRSDELKIPNDDREPERNHKVEERRDRSEEREKPIRETDEPSDETLKERDKPSDERDGRSEEKDEPYEEGDALVEAKEPSEDRDLHADERDPPSVESGEHCEPDARSAEPGSPGRPASGEMRRADDSETPSRGRSPAREKMTESISETEDSRGYTPCLDERRAPPHHLDTELISEDEGDGVFSEPSEPRAAHRKKKKKDRSKERKTRPGRKAGKGRARRSPSAASAARSERRARARRADLERYDVRTLVSERRRRGKDAFGRDVSPERRRSTSSSPRRARTSASPRRARASVSPRRGRGSVSPRRGRTSTTPRRGRISASPRRVRGSISPRRVRTSISPRRVRGSASPRRARGSISPRRARGSISPRRVRSSVSPRRVRGSVSPRRGRGSPSPRRARPSRSPRRIRVEPSPKRLRTSPSPRRARASPSPRRARASPSPRRARASPSPRRARASPSPRRAKASPSPRRTRASPSPRRNRTSPSPSPRRSASPAVRRRRRSTSRARRKRRRSGSPAPVKVKTKKKKRSRSRKKSPKRAAEPHTPPPPPEPVPIEQRRARKRRDRSKHRRLDAAGPSKEVFTSGDNILVSVSFAEGADQGTGTRRRRRRRRTRAPSPAARPVAIIDLARSPCRELTPEPARVIVLSDSEGAGPRTPPAAAPAPEEARGPLTPPEPPDSPDAYDPYEPTASPPPAPAPPAASPPRPAITLETAQKTNMSADEVLDRRPLSPIEKVMALLQSTRDTPAEPPPEGGAAGAAGAAAGGEPAAPRVQLPEAPRAAPKLFLGKPSPIKSDPIKPMQQATKIARAPPPAPAAARADSPYSPGSSDFGELFEPPAAEAPAPRRRARRTQVAVQLADDSLKVLDELPSSAVEMQVKSKFLRKLNRQERVVEEVKLVLKPHYNKKHVTKEQYKHILRRAVPKICHNKTGEINPAKIQALVEAYVTRFRKKNKAAAS